MIENWVQYDGSNCYVQYNKFDYTGTVLELPSGYSNASIIADHNYWYTFIKERIETRIFDYNDDFGCAAEIPYLPIVDENGREVATTSILDHEHKWGDWIVEKEATCEKPGLSVRTCSGCGNKEEKDIPATGHKWGDWTLVAPATDEKNGVEVRICENDPSHVESRSTDKKEDTAKVTSIKIAADPSVTICAGKIVKLSATVSPKNALQTVTWKSSNKDYSTVTSKGVVTTKKAGIGKTVTITAKAKDGSGKTAKIKIKIVKDGVTKIKLKGKTSRPAGKQLTIKATVTAGKTANKELKWISSNKEYATVNKNGVVTLKEAGKGKYVRITAMATDGTGVKASIKIKIT